MTLIKSISGIRGTIGGKQGETLSPLDVVKFTAAFGTLLKNENEKPTLVIGRDARPSGESISRFVTLTLNALGIDVLDLGLSTTPTVEMAVVNEKAQGGIIVTASHNPAGWNAMKFINDKGEFISQSQGKKLLEIAEQNNIFYEEIKKYGKTTSHPNYIDWHIDRILENPLVDVKAIKAKKLNVVIDAVNSTGGIAVPKLLDKLGVQYHAMFCEPNGIFPHNPEPLPENLMQIVSEVTHGHFDLGIVVDPDVDRLVFISENGEPFGEEYTLVAIADYVLSQQKGNTVSNLSSTQALKDITEKYGGQYFASPVGEVNVVAKMKECNAVIGGEGSGGIILPSLHYGRDALIGIALFLSHFSHLNMSASRLRSQYPAYFMSKNRLELTTKVDIDVIFDEIKKKYHANPSNIEDGLKLFFGRDWVHLRKSNTEPIIRIFSESDSQSIADHLIQKIMMDIKELIS